MRGVSAVGITSSLPLAEPIGAHEAVYVLEDQPRPAAGEWPSVHTVVVAGAYFDALRTPLVRGRRFDDRDRVTTTPVAIVNAPSLPGREPHRPTRHDAIHGGRSLS
jgi:putative ABC transport system permease protein